MRGAPVTHTFQNHNEYRVQQNKKTKIAAVMRALAGFATNAWVFFSHNEGVKTTLMGGDIR